jgi:hypothetical protein
MERSVTLGGGGSTTVTAVLSSGKREGGGSIPPPPLVSCETHMYRTENASESEIAQLLELLPSDPS